MSTWDVVVIGEPLVELSSPVAFADGVQARFAVSGDAVNVAAAASAAGARVALAAVLPADDLGEAVAARIAELGIGTDLLRRRPGQQGVYLVHSDPVGEREFFYARAGSVGSSIGPDDLDLAVLREAGAVVASGILGAVSPTGRAALLAAASSSARFVYDPNYRPRLTTADAASALLREVAATAHLVTPSFPGEARALLGAGTAREAAARLRRLGAAHVAVTCGADGAHLSEAAGDRWVDAVPAPQVVDPTGAGDAFLGTTAARLVLGDPLPVAAAAGAAAASLSVGAAGGSSAVPSWQRTLEHLAGAP